MQSWIMKSEPNEYSIEDLERDESSLWYGVRNYLARNYMRDLMREGDRVLFYHSSCPAPGIYGLVRVVEPTPTMQTRLGLIGAQMWRELTPEATESVAIPDFTQFELGKYFDPKATLERPIWYAVTVAHESTLPHPITLTDLRAKAGLGSLKILSPRNRLSITLVTETEWDILKKVISSK